MAVLIEGISVIVRAEALRTTYAGGVPAFEAGVPNNTYCTDGELMRVGFMAPNDVQAYVGQLEQGGLLYVGPSGDAVNIAVVDQRTGIIRPCSWAAFAHVQLDDNPAHLVAVCSAVPSRVNRVALPADWRFENSLTARHRFVETERLSEEMEFVRSENGVDVYRDRVTGQEFYVGRNK
jgi:hypothetical protein